MALLDELATPCLLVEQQRLRRNLERMQALAVANRTALRPHVKTHKCSALARRQEALGARGITVAKVGEAEVFADEGFKDIRLAYPVVGEARHARLWVLRERGVDISFCVDTLEGARAASQYYEARGHRADVLVEVDVGHGRCGIVWDDPHGVAFAREVAALPGLRLVGILTHAGQAYHGPAGGETKECALRRVSSEERDRMLTVARRWHEAGVPGVAPGAFEISIGSTPSMAYFVNREERGFTITEIRPGNYVFYDAMQVGLGSASLQDCALTVLTTVVSKHRDRSGRERLFLDAGKKVFTSDTGSATEGYGRVLYNAARMEPHPHARITGLSEEHGWVQVRGGATFAVGDRVRVVPNHACVTVNTQDELYLVDGEEVLETWKVDARGSVR